MSYHYRPLIGIDVKAVGERLHLVLPTSCLNMNINQVTIRQLVERK